jgi:hypothetical protein
MVNLQQPWTYLDPKAALDIVVHLQQPWIHLDPTPAMDTVVTYSNQSLL